MGYYAAFLDVSGRRCLVVGGGGPAEEKVEGLLASGADVTVVSDTINHGLEDRSAAGEITVVRRGFEEADLDGVFVVIDASGDDASGERVAAAARARSVLVNVLDRPKLCDFIAPAIVRRGPLQIAISTSGASPYMASHLRRNLEAAYGDEYGRLVEMVGQLRTRLRSQGVSLDDQNRVYARVPESGALELLQQGRLEEARAAVDACADGIETP